MTDVEQPDPAPEQETVEGEVPAEPEPAREPGSDVPPHLTADAENAGPPSETYNPSTP